MNATAISVENNVQGATAQVIPFRFEAREVRTMVIDGEPWFVAGDICKALGIVNTTQALQALDEDERSMFNIGRQGKANIINESGLFTLILRSREATTPGTPQHRFRKWVTSEVLPSIRKTGRYEDAHNKMATIVNELIGMTEVNVIKGLIRDKAKVIPIDRRRGFQLAMHNRLHTRFNVPRVELIPAVQFESACNFIASYALEGEWLPKKEKKGGIYLDDYETHHLYLLMSRFAIMSEHRGNMLAAARALDSKPLWTIFGQIDEGRASFASLDQRRDEIYSIYCKGGLRGGYAMTA